MRERPAGVSYSNMDEYIRRPALSLYLNRFLTNYHRWSLVHATIITALVVATEVTPFAAQLLGALSIWIFVAIAGLFQLGYRLHPDGAGSVVPNALTASRAGAAVALLVFVVLRLLSAGREPIVEAAAAWWIAGSLGVVVLTDFFDGRLARRAGSGRFGATWDMECDSVFAIALALYLRVAFHVTPLVLAIGLMRYLYVLLFRYDSDPAIVPRGYKLFAKVVTALIVTGMIVATAPVLSSAARLGIVVFLLFLQLLSFGWDLLLQRRSYTD